MNEDVLQSITGGAEDPTNDLCEDYYCTQIELKTAVNSSPLSIYNQYYCTHCDFSTEIGGNKSDKYNYICTLKLSLLLHVKYDHYETSVSGPYG
ncbi:MAG: hypothetical protein LBJ95_04565 [Oscillospiraceae bacterium]|nr:hypothetical protein [Oscillospiraceae bacterium]